jgi:electron transfer flavoprotein alpha subunit
MRGLDPRIPLGEAQCANDRDGCDKPDHDVWRGGDAMTTLLVAEHDNKTLKDSTNKALTAAKQLGGDVHVLVAGKDAKAVADAAAKLDGVAKVLLADAPAYQHALAEPLAALIVSLAKSYDAIAAPATTNGKNVMPRVAALLDVMPVSDVSKVVAPDTFERPVYAGNAIQTVKSTDAKKVLTIRTSTFQATGEGGSAPVEAVTAADDPGISSFVGEELSKSDRPELTSAKVIISGGRAMQSRDNFTKYIEPVADKLGAAVGASRAAVDAGYAPNDWQVGQTGKVVAPELYIAVGISGAIQHLAGMKDSKVIVAINKDEEAPIFQVADYGLVADLYQALPELDAELAKIKR